MDSFSLGEIVTLVEKFGVVGLVILLWWLDNRRIWAVMEQNKSDMAEQREMYKTNVSLCRDFSSIASDLREIVILSAYP